MDAAQRLRAERTFHDRQARERAIDFAQRGETFHFTDDAYLDHETWIRPAFRQLGGVRGARALDFGCGHGMAAVVLARDGAHVTAFDLSPGYLDEARRRAHANGVHIDFVQADGARLPFADQSFERIWGNAVLHHLDLSSAAPELHRVLRPGGIAVFCEPWGENPLLSWARRQMRYPGKERTPDEQPLGRSHLDVLRRSFPDLQLRGYQLLSMARRVVRQERLAVGLDWCDRMLLARLPRLQLYCRYVVLTLRKSL
jgi:SAM-dependent methyltransferase